MARKSKTTSHKILSIHKISRMSTVFWMGGTISMICLFLPILFQSLDKINASHIAKQVLDINAYIGVLTLILAIIDLFIKRGTANLKIRSFWYLIAMLFLLVINFFAIYPFLETMKETLTNVANHVITQSNIFDFWHSISAIILIIIVILCILFLVEEA